MWMTGRVAAPSTSSSLGMEPQFRVVIRATSGTYMSGSLDEKRVRSPGSSSLAFYIAPFLSPDLDITLDNFITPQSFTINISRTTRRRKVPWTRQTDGS